MNEVYGKKDARVVDRQGDLELVRLGKDADTEVPLYIVYDNGDRVDWLDCIDGDSPYWSDPAVTYWQATYL